MRPVTKVLYALHVPVDTRNMHEATPSADLAAILESAREDICEGEPGARVTGWELPAWSRDPHDTSQEHVPFIDEPERQKIRAAHVWPREGCELVYVRFTVEATSPELAHSVVDRALDLADLGHLHGQSAFRDHTRPNPGAPHGICPTAPSPTTIYTYQVNPPAAPQGPAL